MMDELIKYAPLILAITIYLINQKVFVTPADLEKKHREILEDIAERYATILTVAELQNQFHSMAEKIDKIYEILIEK